MYSSEFFLLYVDVNPRVSSKVGVTPLHFAAAASFSQRFYSDGNIDFKKKFLSSRNQAFNDSNVAGNDEDIKRFCKEVYPRIILELLESLKNDVDARAAKSIIEYLIFKEEQMENMEDQHVNSSDIERILHSGHSGLKKCVHAQDNVDRMPLHIAAMQGNIIFVNEVFVKYKEDLRINVSYPYVC